MVKNLPANVGDTGNMDLIPGLGRSPGGAFHSSILARKFDEQRNLVGYNPWDHKEQEMTKPLSTH